MKSNHPLFNVFILPFFFLSLAASATEVAGAMNDYCVSPPFVSQSIPPNIMVVLDNSFSMCEEAYAGNTYNPTQFDSGLYYGYFDGTKNYKYNTYAPASGSRWEVTTEPITAGTAANPIASGSFLNWVTMLRVDVAKKLLIGGKAAPRTYSAGNTVKLLAETGCDNRYSPKTYSPTNAHIGPFNGSEYRFHMNTNGTLQINAITPNTSVNVPPDRDISIPSSLSEIPDNPPVVAWNKVDETTANGNTDYISFGNSLEPVIMGFTPPANSLPSNIIVRLYISASRTNNTAQRTIQGLLRINGTNYLHASAPPIATSYQLYEFQWPSNPATLQPWTEAEVKQLAATASLQGFGIIPGGTSNKTTSPNIRVTQAYLRIDATLLAGGPYNVIVDQGSTNATGLIHGLSNEARFGLTYYNTEEGGRVNQNIGFKPFDNLITSINNMVPSTWTPLAETLREVVSYFRQDTPRYNAANYTLPVNTANFTDPTTIYRDPYAYNFKALDANSSNMYVPCAKSFVLFLTDGESTRDQNIPGTGNIAPCTSTNLRGCSGVDNPNPRFAGTPIGQTYSSNGTDYMIDVAYWARTNDMRPGGGANVPTTWNRSLPGTQNVYLYPVFLFGTGSSLLKDAAIYGGFVDVNNNNKPDCTTIPGECYRDSNQDGIIEANGNDLPSTYYEGDDGYALEQNLRAAFTDILKRAASSTAVSVLSSSEGSGANLVQSLFYPNRTFNNNIDITWTSDLMNYWYYFDPFFKNAQIREDSVREHTDYTLLDLKNDYITNFYFDGNFQKTMAAHCQDTDGDGDCDTAIDIVPIEDAKPIWRAGVNLWWTEPAERKILTTTDGISLIPFTTDPTSLSSLEPHLGQNAAAAEATINFVRGVDQGNLCSSSRIPCTTTADCGALGGTCESSRNRTVEMNVCSVSRKPCNVTADCGASDGICQPETHTWKLGDIISSTPRIMGATPLNTYHRSTPYGYNDKTYFDYITGTGYSERQQVFVGANDGMLHAFKLGKILQKWSGKEYWQPAKSEGTTGVGGSGTESWAFIPKNALPYLRYLSEPNYCHVYMVDGPIFLADASIEKVNCTQTNYWECAKQTNATASSWRSVVIGSMGIGGATCDTTNSTTNTVPPPLPGIITGQSSFFALDVTDQDNPSILWEFSNKELGVTNIGPAAVKVNSGKRCLSNNNVCSTSSDCPTNDSCVDANGKWFTILASGSTGPITQNEFKGTSDRNLKLFILDLKTGQLLRTIDTGITNAFAGSLSTGSIDLEKSSDRLSGNYQDDVVYIGYVQNTTSGGVLRLVINDDGNPDNWTVSKVIDGIGPVTSSIVNLLDRKSNKLWLYFAEGRYFFKQDDQSNLRRLYGIQEPCYVDDATTIITDYDVRANCSTTLALTDLQNQTTPTSISPTQKGWYVTLDAPTSSIGAERVITNPTADPQGGIFFLSFSPTSDICGFGGTTYLWALDYATGGKVTYIMQGKALVQVSTGEIKEIDLSDSSTFSTKDNRRTVGFYGIPPTGQGLMIVTNPDPVKKFIHIQEQ